MHYGSYNTTLIEIQCVGSGYIECLLGVGVAAPHTHSHRQSSPLDR